MAAFLNGFKLELSAEYFDAYAQAMPHNSDLKSLREKLKDKWFIHWNKGNVYGLPKFSDLDQPFGKLVKLKCDEHLHILNSRINNLLPELFDKYSPHQSKPFAILAQKKEIVSESTAKIGITHISDLLSSFKIRPKYILEAKLVELINGKPFIGLFLKVGTHWQILASLSELEKAGVDLKGLYIVRRNRTEYQRRLVGKVERLSGSLVHLSDSFDKIQTIDDNEVLLEGSKASFTRCLRVLLKDKYEEFEEQCCQQESELISGMGFDKNLIKVGEFLSNKSPLHITCNLEAVIGDRIKLVNNRDYQSIFSASPVEYCFDPARTKRSRYAWDGIEKFGPFDRQSFPKKSPEILVLFPDTLQGSVEKFLAYLKEGINAKKKVVKGNVIEYENYSAYCGGFAKIFGLINPKFTLEKISWLNQNNVTIAKAYKQGIRQILMARESLDIAAAIVVLPDEYAYLPAPENPYLQSKALLLMADIPVQEIRLSNLRKSTSSLQYILRNFSVSLYAKMNGLPWTVDQDLTINDELVIGIGTCQLSTSRFAERQRFVGITTVFRGDGNYLLGSLSEECSYEEYPETLRQSTISILKEIKQRNGWQPKDTVRLVFHAAKPLKNIEIAEIIAECVAEVGKEQNIEFAFLTVSHEHPFTVFDKSQLGISKHQVTKGIYVPQRGTIVQLGRYTRLLCTSDPYLVKDGLSPLPSPLLIGLHQKSTYRDLTYLTEQVLKFTALSWRSVLPVSEPVTIYYSELIASLLARLRNIQDWSPATLNIKLRASKWFL